MKNKIIQLCAGVFGYISGFQLVHADESESINVIGWVFDSLGIPHIIQQLIWVVGFAFWISMLIRVIKSDSKDKILWAVIIIVTNVLGGLIYYFVEGKHISKNPFDLKVLRDTK